MIQSFDCNSENVLRDPDGFFGSSGGRGSGSIRFILATKRESR